MIKTLLYLKKKKPLSDYQENTTDSAISIVKLSPAREPTENIISKNRLSSVHLFQRAVIKSSFSMSLPRVLTSLHVHC